MRACSVGAGATISEEPSGYLNRRLSAPHVPKPFSPPLEASVPDVPGILRMAREMVGGARYGSRQSWPREDARPASGGRPGGSHRERGHRRSPSC